MAEAKPLVNSEIISTYEALLKIIDRTASPLESMNKMHKYGGTIRNLEKIKDQCLQSTADRKRIEELIETVKWQGEKIIRQHKNLGEYTEMCRTEEIKNQTIADQTAEIERLRGVLEPVWVVNDLAELGVKFGDRFFFLYKGGNIEYGTKDDCSKDGIALHDNKTPMKYRIVGKREFGETCQPKAYFDNNYHLTESRLYTEPLIYHEGLSDGKPEDGEWKQLPARPALDAGKE